MHQDGSLPRARRDGLLEETVGEELLPYDQENHTAHCLSPLAASVWRHCDGEHDLTGLAQLAGASDDLIADALHELREKELLVTEPLTPDTAPGESRREAIVRVARYGAAAAAGSMIVSATAATPAMASSGEKPKECGAKAGATTACCECIEGNLGCLTVGKGNFEACKIECENMAALRNLHQKGNATKWWLDRAAIPMSAERLDERYAPAGAQFCG